MSKEYLVIFAADGKIGTVRLTTDKKPNFSDILVIEKQIKKENKVKEVQVINMVPLGREKREVSLLEILAWIFSIFEAFAVAGIITYALYLARIIK